jgi:hypothetical protein
VTADSITNKYATEIRVGQIWADNDPRCKGRTVRIFGFDDAGRATCVVLTNADGKPPAIGRVVRIKVDRLHPTSTGYRLIEDGGQS